MSFTICKTELTFRIEAGGRYRRGDPVMGTERHYFWPRHGGTTEGREMGKLLIDQSGGVNLLAPNRSEVHNDVDAELAVALSESKED